MKTASCGTVEQIAEPLFLLAPGRCFSSLASAMLGQHPQMFALLETQLFVRESMYGWWRDFGSNVHSHGLLRSAAEIIFDEQSPSTIAAARRWLWHRRRHSTCQVFIELANRVTPLVVVEKTPMVTSKLEHMIRILRAFPKARFIHLLRHPIGYCKSLMAFYNARALRHPAGSLSLVSNPESIFFRLFDPSSQNPAADPEASWYVRQATIVEFVAMLGAGQHLSVRSEDLLENPVPIMRTICKWLGLRTDKTAIDMMLRPERSPFAKLGPWNARFGADPSFLNGPALRTRCDLSHSLECKLPWQGGRGLSDKVKELARSLGYI